MLIFFTYVSNETMACQFFDEVKKNLLSKNDTWI